MPEKGQQDESVAGLVVKEAVERAMETEYRDQIVEAVDAAEGRDTGRKRRIPLAGALVGFGAAIGYLLGRGEFETVESHLEEAGASEIIDEMSAKGEDVAETVEPEPDEEPTSGRGRLLATMALVAGAIAGLEFLRRRRADDEAWEPIEEFEPATDADFGSEDDDSDEEMDGDAAEEAHATASEDGDESDDERDE